MKKRLAAFSLMMLMTVFAAQTAIAGGMGTGNQNGSWIEEDRPWHKDGAASDIDCDGIWKKKPDPDEDGRGPSEEDEGVMIWKREITFRHIITTEQLGF